MLLDLYDSRVLRKTYGEVDFHVHPYPYGLPKWERATCVTNNIAF